MTKRRNESVKKTNKHTYELTFLYSVEMVLHVIRMTLKLSMYFV